MSRPLTPAAILEAAESAEAEARKLELQALALREHARLLREAASKVTLTIGRNGDTVETQMHVESAGAKRSAGQFTAEQLKHPFVAMLARRRISVGDVAKATGFPRTSIQAWYKPADDGAHRAIPEDAARTIRDRYGVPLSAWARIKAAK